MDLRAVVDRARRASLMKQGVAEEADLASPVVSDAKNKKKKNGKKGDINKRCKQQAAEWTFLVSFTCGDNSECDPFLACAQPLETCNFDGFLTCVLDLQTA